MINLLAIICPHELTEHKLILKLCIFFRNYYLKTATEDVSESVSEVNYVQGVSWAFYLTYFFVKNKPEKKYPGIFEVFQKYYSNTNVTS